MLTSLPRFALPLFGTLIALAVGFLAFWVVTHHHVVPGFKGCAILRTDADDRSHCYERLILEKADATSLATALTWADKQATDGGALVSSDCHHAAHLIGEQYLKDPTKRRELLDAKGFQNQCSGGATHELLIWMVTSGGAAKAQQNLTSICPSGKLYEWNNCVHALGHAFVRAERSNTFTSDCDIVSDVSARYSCRYGGYMQLMEDMPTTAAPASICDPPKEKDDYTCYSVVITVLINRGELSYSKLQDFCGTLQGTSKQMGCYEVAGNLAKGQDYTSCTRISNADVRASCLYGAQAEVLTKIDSPAKWPSYCKPGSSLAEGCAAYWGRHLKAVEPVGTYIKAATCERPEFDRGMVASCKRAAAECWPYKTAAWCDRNGNDAARDELRYGNSPAAVVRA